MIPVLAKLGPFDPADALIVALVVFLLALAWRRAARALGEEVPPLTAAGVLFNLVVSVVVAAAVVYLVNRFGPVEIKAYGLMLVLGFSAATAWCIHAGAQRGYAATVWLDVVLYVLIGAIIGARLVYVLLDWRDYSSQVGQTLALWQGGLSFHGGVAGGLLAGAIYAWRSRQSLLKLSDVAAPSIALGYAFGRIGCFLNGCCYGTPTDLPWGVVFPQAVGADGAPITAPVHPTQLYGVLASLAIFALLVRLSGHLRRPGHPLLAYLVLYSIYRFPLEYLRRGVTAVPLSFLPELTVGQFASAIVAVAALVTMAVTWPRGGKGDAK